MREEANKENDAARKIQSVYRAYKARQCAELIAFERWEEEQELMQAEQEESAAIRIQACFRGYLARKHVEEIGFSQVLALAELNAEKEDKAARIIQKAFRRYRERISKPDKIKRGDIKQAMDWLHSSITEINRRAKAELKAAELRAQATLVQAKAEAEAIRMIQEAKSQHLQPKVPWGSTLPFWDVPSAYTPNQPNVHIPMETQSVPGFVPEPQLPKWLSEPAPLPPGHETDEESLMIS